MFKDMRFLEIVGIFTVSAIIINKAHVLYVHYLQMIYNKDNKCKNGINIKNNNFINMCTESVSDTERAFTEGTCGGGDGDSYDYVCGGGSVGGSVGGGCNGGYDGSCNGSCGKCNKICLGTCCNYCGLCGTYIGCFEKDSHPFKCCNNLSLCYGYKKCCGLKNYSVITIYPYINVYYYYNYEFLERCVKLGISVAIIKWIYNTIYNTKI